MAVAVTAIRVMTAAPLGSVDSTTMQASVSNLYLIRMNSSSMLSIFNDMPKPDWTGISMFLAVAEQRSLRAAALSMGVTQPTVSRHVRTLEDALGVPLFERGRDGHTLTEAGRGLLPHAAEMRDAADALRGQGSRMREVANRLVHVAANDWPAMLLSRHASDLILESGVRLEVSSTVSRENLTVREADIAIWHGLPKTGDLISRRIGSLDCAVHASVDLATRARKLEPESWFSTLPWIGFTEAQEHYLTMRWLARRWRGATPALRFDRTEQILEAVAAGAGLAILPCAVAAPDPRIEQLGSAIETLNADYWLLCHREAARAPWIRAAIDLLVTVFAKAAGPALKHSARQPSSA
jgi:DNA-binding transcriptional LysR family regulator